MIFFLGLVGGFSSIALWFLFAFYNPYSSPTTDSMATTFFMLFLPACLAISSTITSKKSLMLIAFAWSFPFSFYLVLTPGIFAFFGVTCVIYLICFIFFRSPKSKKLLAH